MKPKDLLSQLSSLEYSLNDFSFEELSASEASLLKKSFDAFRQHLEEKIFQPTSNTIRIDNNDYGDHKQVKTEKQDNNLKDANLRIAEVSHEIRTPLNGIIGFSDLLKEDSLTELQLERVNAIQTASYSLLEIINELLDYSKLSAGLEKFEFVDFNLNGLVNDVMYLCNTLMTNSSVSLEASIDTNIPTTLIGDPSKLSQVLLNLLNNAIKFVEEGSIKLNISLKKQKANIHFLEFEIVDTGIGISEENLKHIFDSFQQAEKDTYVKYGGTGLGLSIVKQIIENQGGDIAVSSKLNTGTTFKFLLPYAEGSSENVLITKKTAPNDTKELSVKGMQVLVFEDNTLNQKLIEQRLKSWECIPHVTDNGLYGLHILETHTIDMVLMDLKMPNMDGFEITKRIRNFKNKKISQVPIVVLTADFTIQDQERSKEYKINDFILKPYAPDELKSKLIKNHKSMKTTLRLESKVINPEAEVYPDATKVNLAVILEDCMGQIDLLEELIILYKQNALEFMGVIRMHLETENMDIMASAAHKIKSGLAMMQSESLHRIVVQMHGICKANGDRKHLKFLFDCFVKEYPIVEAAIEEQVKALKK